MKAATIRRFGDPDEFQIQDVIINTSTKAGRRRPALNGSLLLGPVADAHRLVATIQVNRNLVLQP